MENVQNSAALHNIYRVKAFSWTPSAISASGSPVRSNGGTLKEKYYCRYKDHNNKMKDTVVILHWAEKQFSIMALAYVQKIFYNMTKKELCKDDPDHPVDDHGHVDVELEGVEMEYNNTVSNRVKLTPEKSH